MKKRIFGFVLVLCMLMGLAVVPAHADSGTCGTGVTWELTSGGTLTISGSGAIDEQESLNPPWNRFNVKKIIVGNGITAIGKNAFDACINATSATIGSSVTTIGDNAFGSCQKLTSVVIPDNVTYVGSSAFSHCYKLDSVTIGSNVATIGAYAFYSTAVTSISIPASVTSVGNRAFNCCESLTAFNVAAANPKFSSQDGILFDKNKTVLYCCPCKKQGAYTIPSTVTQIYGDAFDRCSEITAITIPGNVSTIGAYAFSATGISSVTIPDHVAVLSDSLFFNCPNLSEINLGSGVTTINRFVFQWCPSLTTIVLPGQVTTIGQGAFEECSGLTSIVIPASVTTITATAFNTCENLADVYYTGSAAQWGMISIGTQNRYLESAAKHYNYSVSGTLSGTCGDNLTWVLSDGTLTISGTGAMYNYSSGSAPWYGAKDSVTSIVIGEGVTTIGAYAFADCANAVSVSIPGSLTAIANHAFDGCTGLSMVHIKSLAKWCEMYFIVILEQNGEGSVGLMDAGGVTTNNPLYYAHNLYLDGALVTALVIPDGVTSIGSGAFIGCSGITSVTIPASVTSIGAQAFYGCSGLTDVYYAGTEDGWSNVSIDSSDNAYLQRASVHYTAPSITLTGRGTTFIVNLNNISGRKCIVLAAYKDGQLTELQKSIYSGGSGVFSVRASFDTVKAMVWEDLASMTPVCEAVSQ